ncbi:hypothetical protein [Neorhizobium lilium]|uniref:hypothetical protein n=1 Tax=Neorhizobium lilium TaxID=2503024 RepID=UPI001FE0EFA0|nr:hypothetical protein [Neorhizobium lilium]
MRMNNGHSAFGNLVYALPVPTPVGLVAQLGYLEQTFADAGVALKSIIDSPDRSIRQIERLHEAGLLGAVAAREEGGLDGGLALAQPDASR